MFAACIYIWSPTHIALKKTVRGSLCLMVHLGQKIKGKRVISRKKKWLKNENEIKMGKILYLQEGAQLSPIFTSPNNLVLFHRSILNLVLYIQFSPLFVVHHVTRHYIVSSLSLWMQITLVRDLQDSNAS